MVSVVARDHGFRCCERPWFPLLRESRVSVVARVQGFRCCESPGFPLLRESRVSVAFAFLPASAPLRARNPAVAASAPLRARNPAVAASAPLRARNPAVAGCATLGQSATATCATPTRYHRAARRGVTSQPPRARAARDTRQMVKDSLPGFARDPYGRWGTPAIQGGFLRARGAASCNIQGGFLRARGAASCNIQGPPGAAQRLSRRAEEPSPTWGGASGQATSGHVTSTHTRHGGGQVALQRRQKAKPRGRLHSVFIRNG
jgi:hypothetical protein